MYCQFFLINFMINYMYTVYGHNILTDLRLSHSPQTMKRHFYHKNFMLIVHFTWKTVQFTLSK